MDVVSSIALGATTLVILLAALVTAGFVVLFRKRGDRSIRPFASADLAGLTRSAGSLLVRLDDALRDGDYELGFAIAQFGADSAKPYADALADARSKVAEAFRIKQTLDDAIPDSDQQRRAWTLQIIALCQQADAALAGQDTTFGALRALEVNAAGTLADVRSRIAASTRRLAGTRATLAELAGAYVESACAAVAANPNDAEKALIEATTAADVAAQGISDSGVSAVSGHLADAVRAAQRADQLLDVVDRTARDLRAATAAIAVLRSATTADLAEARSGLTSAPDADTGRAIIDAIAEVEGLLAADRTAGKTDPAAELDTIGDAVSRLDLALASARNQTQRLEHARAAYVGTLVSAKSQIATLGDYIARFGGGVDARTRLAEAERQLMIAEAEVDPVEALDAVRRSVTLARDADALARYETMGR